MNNLLSIIDSNQIVLITRPGCDNCIKLKNYFLENNHMYYHYDVSKLDDNEYEDVVSKLKNQYDMTVYPLTFVEKKCINDYKEVMKMLLFKDDLDY